MRIDQITEKWSQKYKKSIDCNNPKGFSQKAHCAGKKKKTEDVVTELVSGPENKFHLINRVNKVADICATMGDKPLLYREVRNTRGMYGDKTLIIKATPRGMRDEKLLGSGNLMQPVVLNKLGIEHAVFATMDPHPGTQGKFGANYFMVPIGAYKVYSSPQVKDLGTENSYNDKDRKMFAPPSDEEVAKFEAVADTYKEGWPGAGFPNEVILDCEQYYLINVGEFVKKYAGEKARQMYTRDPDKFAKIKNDINKELLTSRFKTYNDMAWYLRNPVTNLLKEDVTEDIDVNTQPKEIILDPKVDEGVNDPHIFKAVFMAGGPGSGKSFVAQNLLGGTGLRAVNSDEVYEFLLKRQGLSLDPDTIASPQGQEIRGTAKDLTTKRQQNYIDGRIGLLIDGTGKNVSVIQDLAQKLKSIGYSVSMIFVNTSLEVAQQRNRQRDRVLPSKLVADSWNEVQQNLMKYQQIFGADRFHIVDNSGGLEDLDRQKNFDKVYNEVQRFLNTPPKHKKALAWIQNQKAQNNAKPTTNSGKSDGGVTSTN